MNRLTLSPLAVAALALILPAAGAASLPAPKVRLIEVPTSIGGVRLEQKLKSADRAWGKAGVCDLRKGSSSCAYNDADRQTGSAVIDAAVGYRVSSFGIYAGLDHEGDFNLTGPLSSYKTPEGIAIGGKRTEVEHAYPTALKTVNKTGFLIPGKGKSYMTFQTLDGKHVTAITVVDGKHQG